MMYKIKIYARLTNGYLKFSEGRGTLRGCLNKAREFPESHYRVVINRNDSPEREYVRVHQWWCLWPKGT